MLAARLLLAAVFALAGRSSPSGTPESNREQGFRSPVLLDQGFGAGSVLGAGGTPSAVIVDEYGIMASEVGVGAPAVLALAGATTS